MLPEVLYKIDYFCQGFFSAIQPSEIPPEIHPGIPLELSLEIHLEIPFEIPFEIPPGILLELYLEIHVEIPFEIPPHSKTHPQPPYQAAAWSYRYIWQMRVAAGRGCG